LQQQRAGGRGHRRVDPGEPAQAVDRVKAHEALAVAAGLALGFLKDLEPQRSALNRLGGDAEGAGEGIVDEDDAALSVATDDDVADRVDDAAVTFEVLAQTPGLVGQRFDARAQLRGLFGDVLAILGQTDEAWQQKAAGADDAGDEGERDINEDRHRRRAGEQHHHGDERHRQEGGDRDDDPGQGLRSARGVTAIGDVKRGRHGRSPNYAEQGCDAMTPSWPESLAKVLTGQIFRAFRRKG